MRNRHGFTLIELLIVVVIIGILAAIAIPKFSRTRSRAVEASGRADLRNLATAMEQAFSDFATYPTGVNTTAGAVSTATQVAFRPSGTATLTIVGAGTNNWRATWVQGTTTCAIFIGATVQAPATIEGSPACNSTT